MEEKLILKMTALRKAQRELKELRALNGQGLDLKKVYDACGIMCGAQPGRVNRFVDFCLAFVERELADLKLDLFEMEDD